MNKTKQQVKEFLKHLQMDFEALEMDKYCRVFQTEMAKGLIGKQSSLSMLPTYLEVNQEVPLNQRVIVLDAGGTNFRVATVYFNQDKIPVIENFKKYPMPGIEAEVSKEQFFNILAGYMKEVAKLSNNIGFCFSYPVDMYPNKDGKLIHFTKEIKAKTVEGTFIGATLKQALQDFEYSPEKIVILNDTVATLLAGVSASKNKVYGGYIGFILGTGTNIAYNEHNKNIKKANPIDLHKKQIINVESGGFCGIPQGQIDREFDLSTIDPGKYGLEKMVSGRYLGNISHLVIQKAVKEGLFSANAASELQKIDNVTTVNINHYLHNPLDEEDQLGLALRQGSENDRMLVYFLLNSLVERAAKLAAMAITATVLQSNEGENPNKPICITAEGTTFYQLKSLKRNIEFYLKDYLSDQKDRYIEFVNIENATLIGAAVAGLTN